MHYTDISYTGIPRLTQFHLARIFEHANCYLLVIPRLARPKTGPGEGLLKAKVGFAFRKFRLTPFFGGPKKRFMRGMPVSLCTE